MNDKNAKKPQSTPKTKITKLEKSLDRKRKIYVAIGVVLALTIFSYGMSIESFADYNPPDYLQIEWGDYYKVPDGVNGEPSSGHPEMGVRTTGNEKTPWEHWSAAYPYRAVLIGGFMESSGKCSPVSYVIYSKVPTLDCFEFRYVELEKPRTIPYTSARVTGLIEARIKRDDWNNSEIKGNFRIKRADGGDFNDGSLNMLHMCDQADVTSQVMRDYPVPVGLNLITYYALYFDFYYQCSNNKAHGKNTELLEITGLRSIPEVPYNYILSCHAHSGGGSQNATSNGSGSNGNGSGSSSGGQWNVNIVDEIPPESSYPEPSVPDDWKKPLPPSSNPGKYPFEEEENIPDLEFSIPSIPHKPGIEDDNGENGDTWELPKDKGIPDMTPPDGTIPEAPKVKLPELQPPEVKLPELQPPEVKLPELQPPEVKLPELQPPEVKLPELQPPEVKLPEFKPPEVNLPVYEFTPPETTWPPPFPLS